jgi:HD-GYP domain-containing protein (c-di-GMP phosphodiesterase class II)
VRLHGLLPLLDQPLAEARARIAAGAGAQFDPAVVEAFGRIIDAFDREAAEDRPPQRTATPRDEVSVQALEDATPARVR